LRDKKCTANHSFDASQGRLVFVKMPERDRSVNQKGCAIQIKTFTLKLKTEKYLTRE